ncbi:hypothetical protein O0557_16655, partial [Dickeya solani]
MPPALNSTVPLAADSGGHRQRIAVHIAVVSQHIDRYRGIHRRMWRYLTGHPGASLTAVTVMVSVPVATPPAPSLT